MSFSVQPSVKPTYGILMGHRTLPFHWWEPTGLLTHLNFPAKRLRGPVPKHDDCRAFLRRWGCENVIEDAI